MFYLPKYILFTFGIFLVWLSPSSNTDRFRLLSISKDTVASEIPKFTILFYLYNCDTIDLNKRTQTILWLEFIWRINWILFNVKTTLPGSYRGCLFEFFFFIFSYKQYKQFRSFYYFHTTHVQNNYHYIFHLCMKIYSVIYLITFNWIFMYLHYAVNLLFNNIFYSTKYIWETNQINLGYFIQPLSLWHKDGNMF